MRTLKIILTLALTCIFSAGVLSLSDKLAEHKIKENQKKAINQAIFKMIKQAAKIQALAGKKIQIYKAFDKNGHTAGFAFIAEGSGYQGKISILCATDVSFRKLLGIEIIESMETPGLGARISEDWFKQQFRGLSVLKPITYGKKADLNNNQIQAITGATISSRSVVRIINNAMKKAEKTAKNEQN